MEKLKEKKQYLIKIENKIQHLTYVGKTKTCYIFKKLMIKNGSKKRKYIFIDIKSFTNDIIIEELEKDFFFYFFKD